MPWDDLADSWQKSSGLEPRRSGARSVLVVGRSALSCFSVRVSRPGWAPFYTPNITDVYRECRGLENIVAITRSLLRRKQEFDGALGNRRGQRPALTSRSAPFTYEAASLRSHTMASATSSALPGRPSGVCAPSTA